MNAWAMGHKHVHFDYQIVFNRVETRNDKDPTSDVDKAFFVKQMGGIETKQHLESMRVVCLRKEDVRATVIQLEVDKTTRDAHNKGWYTLSKSARVQRASWFESDSISC